MNNIQKLNSDVSAKNGTKPPVVRSPLLKDVLHLYLGCKVLVIDVDGQTFEDQVESVIKDRAGNHKFSIYEFGDCPFDDEEYYQQIKPILRSTKSVTQEEWDNAPKSSLHIGVDGIFYSPELFSYLLSLKIDLFNLIENGLAIDAASKR